MHQTILRGHCLQKRILERTWGLCAQNWRPSYEAVLRAPAVLREADPKASAAPLCYSGHSSTPSSSLTSRSSPRCWFITHSWRGCTAARIRLPLRQSGASARLPSLSQNRTLASQLWQHLFGPQSRRAAGRQSHGHLLLHQA